LRPHAANLLPAGSTKISADGNLASKLARLAGEADSIRTQMCETGPALRKPALFQKSSSVDSEIIRRRGAGGEEDERR